MRSRSFIAVVAALTILLLACVGMVLYDRGQEDQIAKGVTVGGVDIGGLTEGEARARLEAEVARPLQRPIKARFKGRAFELDPAKADVSVDVAATVAQALDRSRDGNILTRSIRGLTGGSLDEDLEVAVTYDRTAVQRMVDKVAKRLNRDPVDADVDISTAGVEVVKAEKGRRIAAGKLERGLRNTIMAANRDRVVPVTARPVKPKVTTSEVAEKYPDIIVVNRSTFQVSLYEDLKLSKTYTVAIGAAGFDTPVGRYAIQNKQVDPYWHVPDSDWAGSLAGQVIPPGPQNPLKARWMGIYNGAGFHGTDATYSLGSAASHGCVRMAVPDVIDLYDRVDVGTPVYIG